MAAVTYTCSSSLPAAFIAGKSVGLAQAGDACEYYSPATKSWIAATIIAADLHQALIKIDVLPDVWIRQESSRIRPSFPVQPSPEPQPAAAPPPQGLQEEVCVDLLSPRPGAPLQQPRVQRFPELPNMVPLIAGIERLEPEDVHRMLQGGDCILVDVRGEDRACGWIMGSVHIPAVESGECALRLRLPELTRRWAGAGLVVLHCQYSCHRAPQNANWYREMAPSAQRVAILAGGFRGWEQCGLPVEHATGEAERGRGTALHGAAADAFALQQGLECAARGGGAHAGYSLPRRTARL